MTSISELRAGVEGEIAAKPVKAIANKHAIFRSKLAATQQELTEKKIQLKQLEREVYLAEGGLTIVEENLRGIKEKYFHATNSLVEKESLHEELVREVVEVQWREKLAKEKYTALESKYVDFQVDKAIRIDQMNGMEVNLGDEGKRRELEELTTVVHQYTGYKERLAGGDPDLLRIQSGDAFVELETRKTGIRDAFARREARVEGIYVEIDEKNEAVNGLKQAILIKEKQNQAKLRRLQRELQDKESTENHLKQTVEYLDRQIDPAVSKGNTNISSSVTHIHPRLYTTSNIVPASNLIPSNYNRSTSLGQNSYTTFRK